MEKEDLILKGLNFGYLAAQLDPTLASSLTEILKDASSDYAEGFRAGVRELELEKGINKEEYLFPGIDQMPDMDEPSTEIKEMEPEKGVDHDEYLFPGMDQMSGYDLDFGTDMDKDEIDLEPDL